MPQAIIKKIKELQRAPDKVKKRWLIGATTLSMTVIIGLWLAYLNATLPKIAPVAKNGEKTEPNDSVGLVFGRGFKTIFNDFKEKVNALKNQTNMNLGVLKNQIQKKNEFSVEAEKNGGFLPAAREEASSTLLP